MVDPSPESVELARFSLWRSKLDCVFGWFDDAEQAAESLFSPTTMAAASDNLPYLLLLEAKLPRMDGLELLRQVRNHAHTRDLPVVMFCDGGDAADEAAAMAAGANSFLIKPVDAREFMQLVVDTVVHWRNIANGK
jgi:two-component system response regulator